MFITFIYSLFRNIFMIFVKSFDFRVPKIKRLEGNSKVITVKYGKGTNTML